MEKNRRKIIVGVLSELRQEHSEAEDVTKAINQLTYLDPHEKDNINKELVYYDDVTGKPLDHKLATEARRLEMDYFRKMNVHEDVNFRELARSSPDFNGAMCKAICVEAGMKALRRGGTFLTHEDFVQGIATV